MYFDGSWWEVPLKVQSYFHPFQRDLERPLLHLGGIQNKSITLMVVRDAYCIASRQWFSIGVDRTDCIYKVWFHCESKCLSPDDTVEKMHRAVFPQCELPNVCSDVQLGWMTFHIIVFLHCGRACESSACFIYWDFQPGWTNWCTLSTCVTSRHCG